MKKLISVITIAFIAALFVVSAVSPSYAAEKREVSQKVGKPLQEAQTLMTKKQFEEAYKKIEEARAVPEKTPFEEFKINEFAASVLLNLHKESEAAAMWEKLSESSFATPEQAEMYSKGVIALYARTNNNNKLLELLPKWIKTHPGDTDMIFALSQAQSKAGQQKAAKDTLEDLIRSAEKSGQKPKQEWLLNLANLSYKMAGNKWDKNALAVVEKTLRYYPNATLWQQMLGGMKEQQLSDGVKFQLYRLMLAVGALKSGEDYTELAQLANSFGLRAEGVNVLNAGFAAKELGEGDAKERDNRKLVWMKGLMDKDKATLPADEQKAKAAADGNGDVQIGEDYIGYGQYAQAIEAIERGIKKGGIKKPDAAQMALGIAYYNNKQKDQARAAFKAVPANSELKSIADLWILHIGS